MVALGILVFVLTSNVIIGIFAPILLPVDFLLGVKEMIVSLNVFNALVPINLTMVLIYWTFTILVTKWTVRFGLGLIAMSSGAGKPEI